ncbi:MAG: hypothetical protein GY808_17235 [Gammaproteobacteria bacterium]|nr:hypothetical protein [Gammaproteobacteria bacterium]
MGILIVIDGDKVEGTDNHNVSGTGTLPGSPPVPLTSFTGTADFDYKGSMTDELSDMVSISDKAVALVTSKSSLDPGEDSTGGHAPISAKNIVPIPTMMTNTEVVSSITESIGTGIPSSDMGSSFVKIDGDGVLFDGDSIDTCDGSGGKGTSTVTAENQDFVSCSE